jgi:WD40 repeat protein
LTFFFFQGDGTFRLWDCRISGHSVQIFNGHTKTVNCALFYHQDRLVSSSDDGFVHIWDSRSTNCSPMISFECVSPCNRLTISQDILAVPLDNRDIRFYSMTNGEKLHVQRRTHSRAVQCCSLLSLSQSNEYLLASGSLDRQMQVWHLKKLKRSQSKSLIKSIDESITNNSSSIFNEQTKGNLFVDGQNRTNQKRTPLIEKANYHSTFSEKKTPLSMSINTNSEKVNSRNINSHNK